MLSLALAILAMSPTMAGPSSVAVHASAAPPPFFTALASNPGTECDGSAISGVTHTRASAAYCENSLGVLTSRAVNSPRVSNLGILVEGSRTNLVIRNAEFDNAAWTKTNTTVTTGQPDPLGGTEADQLTWLGVGALVESTAFVPGQTTGTASVWLQNGNDGHLARLIVRDTTAGVDRATCSDLLVNGTWTRHSCNATGLTSGNNHVLRIYYDQDDSGVAPSAWRPQFEAPLANFMTSTIDTAGASVIRAIDVYTFAGSDISTAGCLSATVTFGQSGQFGGGILANGTEKMLGTGTSTTVTANDGTNTVTATVPDLTGRTVNVLAKWSGSSLTVVADGVTATGSFDGSFSATTTMRIGATAAGSGYCNCWVDNIKAGTHPESCN